MRILRWIAFLPAAAIMGLLMGKLGDIVGILTFHGKTWSACLFSGFVAAGSFILAGFKVAPLRNAVVKWTLIAICLTFGVMSIIGGLFSNEPINGFAGVGMIIAALGSFALRPQTINIANRIEGSMSHIITYKEGCYSQIKLDSGERILLSVAQSGVAIFKLHFFGLIPGSKIAEWKPNDLPHFMFLFGGVPFNQTPFNFIVQKLTSFDSIEQLRKFMIRKPGLFDTARQEQLIKRSSEAAALAGVNPRDIPDEIFRQVGKELEQGKVDNTMQAKATALSHSDPELREAVYLLLRAEQVMRETAKHGKR